MFEAYVDKVITVSQRDGQGVPPTMTRKTVGVRVSLGKDTLKIIALKSSPRGTKFLGKGVQVKLPFKDKEVRRSQIEQAIIEVTDP